MKNCFYYCFFTCFLGQSIEKKKRCYNTKERTCYNTTSIRSVIKITTDFNFTYVSCIVKTLLHGKKDIRDRNIRDYIEKILFKTIRD